MLICYSKYNKISYSIDIIALKKLDMKFMVSIRNSRENILECPVYNFSMAASFLKTILVIYLSEIKKIR